MSQLEDAILEHARKYLARAQDAANKGDEEATTLATNRLFVLLDLREEGLSLESEAKLKAIHHRYIEWRREENVRNANQKLKSILHDKAE